MTVKERELLKKYLMEGIAFNPKDKPTIKLKLEEQQSMDWHRDYLSYFPNFKFAREFYFGGM